MEKRIKGLNKWLSRAKVGSKNRYKIETYYPSSQICSHCGYQESKRFKN